jgi:acyl-CoA thioester hydrolase
MSTHVIEYEAVVLPEWIDSNGHLNLAYYVVIFDLATDAYYDADSKRLHYFHEMFHVESGDRAAVQELMALHIDMNVRRVAPYPPDRQAMLAEAVAKYAPAELPKGAGRRIGMPGK